MQKARSTAVTVNILIMENQRHGGTASTLPLALGFTALPLSVLVKIARENKLCSSEGNSADLEKY